jgi:hypothetical protein
VKISPPVVTGAHGRYHIEEIIEKTSLNQREAILIFKKVDLEIAEKFGHHRVESGYSYCGK